MLNRYFIRRWVIKICRYIFRQKFLPIMAGPLKGYLWSTSSSYDYLLGEYEDPDTLKQFLSWLETDSVYFDIGSNVGFHALTANRVINKGKIYAFEPMPAVREIFEKHISLNSKLIISNNIKLSDVAISDVDGQVEFSNDIVHRDGNTYVKQSYVFSGTTNKITVPCLSVDGLLKQGYEKPDIIKIDVEGAEYDVLVGARETLQRYRPNILLATHECHLPGVNEKCVNLLTELGYDIKHTGTYHKYSDGLDDYIAVHKSKLKH